MNMLQDGAEKLQTLMERHAGVEVTYKRPGGSQFRIVAIPGRNPVEITDRDGMVLRSQIHDFIVKIHEFKKRMTTGEKRPQRGDEITYGEIIYVVNGEDFATSHYEPADSYQVAWRIHTKADRSFAA